MSRRKLNPLSVLFKYSSAEARKIFSLQQQFTADAAHELRTPLTAIKLQLDNLTRAPSEASRLTAIHKLSEGIDRCIHLASQLLIASRSMTVKANA